MSKVIEWRVICPHCDMRQTYHSHQKQIKGQRSKKCNRCGRSFAVKKRRLSVLPNKRKELKEEHERKGEGFHKYSKKST